MRNNSFFKKIIALAAVFSMTSCISSCGNVTDAATGHEEQLVQQEIIAKPVKAPNFMEIKPGSMENTKLNLNRDLSISFIGDMATDHFFKENYDRAGIGGVISPELLDMFTNADLFVANHEYCSTDIDESNKLTYQTWIEHVPTANEAMLEDMGLDLVSMANNHAFDYGLQGFIDTLDTLKSHNIKYVGGGMDVEEATGPVVYEMGGRTIAFFSASSLLTEQALSEWTATESQPGISVLFNWYSTYPKMEKKIKEAKEKYDYVVALTHWGVEGNHAFNGDEQNLAHMLIDIGVDVIIGGHAHVVQGVEYYKDGVVFYGLGNFLFAPEPVDTMVVTMSIDREGELGFKVTPVKSAYYYVQKANDNTVFDIINNNSVNAHVSADGTVSRTN